MKTLVQTNMFGVQPTVVKTWTDRETRPHNPSEWHASLNGQWEIAQALERAQRDAKANEAITEPVI